jgi:hypothetical protein
VGRGSGKGQLRHAGTPMQMRPVSESQTFKLRPTFALSRVCGICHLVILGAGDGIIHFQMDDASILFFFIFFFFLFVFFCQASLTASADSLLLLQS